MAGLLSMLGKTAGRAFQKHPIGAPVATGAGLAALTGTLGNEESGWVGRNQGKVHDAFGFGTERPAYTEEQAQAVLKAAKESLAKDGSIPKEIIEQLARLRPEDYAGFMGGEDFAEELHSYQQYIGGEFKQREDGRYEVGSLLLGEGQSPEDYLMESAPIIENRGF